MTANSRRCGLCRDRMVAGQGPAHEFVCSVCGRCQKAATLDVPACASCEDKIRANLHDLPEMYALLAGELEPGAAAPSEGVRHTKADAAPIPVRLDVLSARAYGGIVKDLTDAENEVRDFFDLTFPPFRGDVEQTVAGATEFLLVHLSRLCNEWGNIDSYAEKIRNWHQDCQRMLGTRDRAFSPGECPLMVELPDGRSEECRGRLSVDSYGIGQVECRACGATWGRESWLILGQEIQEQVG